MAGRWLGYGEGIRSGPSDVVFQPKTERQDEKKGLCGTLEGESPGRTRAKAREAGTTPWSVCRYSKILKEPKQALHTCVLLA